MNKVTLVLNPDFGRRVESLATNSHVWIVDTPANQSAASLYWANNPEYKTESGITTFQPPENASPLESCLNILDTIDEHHRDGSSSSPYFVLEVIGLQLNEELRSAITVLGFTRFETTLDGFLAERLKLSEDNL